jgi:antitoxin (DNA-binding transcriptional repressor) of toxin-antitoxin stability system
MNKVSTTYLQANIGEIVLMLIRGEEVLLTRNGKELGKIIPWPKGKARKKKGDK